MRHSSLRGRDLHSPSNELVENQTGSDIVVLKCVKYVGIGAAYPSIALANGDTDLVRGITQETIVASGGVGYVTALGFLVDVNTSAWIVGTKLYCDASGNLTTVPTGLPIASVLKQHATTGVIYIDNTGITKNDLDALQFPDALSLEIEWMPLYPGFYTEPTYDIDNKIIETNIWDSPAKLVHIFQKIYTYTGPLLTEVEVTRVIDGQTLTKTITYNIDGYVDNVQRTYTP